MLVDSQVSASRVETMSAHYISSGASRLPAPGPWWGTGRFFCERVRYSDESIVALHSIQGKKLSIGDEKALARLVDESANRSSEVERTTHRRLALFYLERYPELSERALRTCRLSLQDADNARAVRVRRAGQSTSSN